MAKEFQLKTIIQGQDVLVTAKDLTVMFMAGLDDEKSKQVRAYRVAMSKQFADLVANPLQI